MTPALGSALRVERKRADRDPPKRLPTGVTLPDGTTLTYPASRDCGCETCLRAFEALRRGDLELAQEGRLPW